MSFTQPLNADQSVHESPAVGTAEAVAGSLPTSILDYDLETRLGSGGYGEVWRAVGPGGLPKAVKILFGRRDGQQAEAELKSLQRMRDLRHPFLLSVERIEVCDNRLVVVTELADCNLEERFNACRNEGQPGIPRDELLTYLRDAADALDFMYEQHGLQHLDIKPDNLLVQGRHVKVADFGLAKNVNLPGVSVINGFTPLYAPPEIFEGKPGGTSDQYSLAIVYQTMLTGTPPFNGRTAAQLTSQHLRSQPDLSPLPATDRPVIAKALSKNVKSRFDSCRRFVDELASLQSGRRRVASLSSSAARIPGDTDRINPLTTASQLVDEESQPVQTTCVPVESLTLRPTLVVGVGGLAGRVIAALKAETGSVNTPNQPPVGFLQIDSDRNDLSQLTSASADLLLAEDEVVCIPLRTSKEYRQATGTDLSWISRRWLFNIPRSGQVEGIRPLGRLALCDHYSPVRKRLQAAIQQAAAAANSGDSDRIDIYIIGATSGGTASGCLADIGFLMRDILRNTSGLSATVNGMLLHGTSGARTVADVQDANTVSCLQELRLLNSASAGIPRGLRQDAADSDAGPFDHTYFFHLGEELATGDFEHRLSDVSHYLRTAVLTDAGHDFRAWRENSLQPTDTHTQLRILGVGRLDQNHYVTASHQSQTLCCSVVNRWFGPADERSLGTAVAESGQEALSLLASLGLTDQTLPDRVMSLLRGETGKAIEQLSENVYQNLCTSISDASQDDFNITDCLAQLTEAETQQPPASTPTSLPLMVDQVETKLQKATQQAATAIWGGLVSLLDSPHRLNVCSAVQTVLCDALGRTHASAQALVGEIEQASHELNSLLESHSLRPGAGADAGVDLDALRGLCRQYCTLKAYKAIYRCFLQHISDVQREVQHLASELAIVQAQLKEMATGCSAGTSDIPEPVIDAFDSYLRSSSSFTLASLLQHNHNVQASWATLCSAAVEFLMKASADVASADNRQGSQTGFPQNAWPVFHRSGGRRRVLATIPASTSTESWTQKLRQVFGDCVAVRPQADDHLSVVCEIEGISIDRIVKRLTCSNSRISDIAGRVHTRNDVDW
jgi:serine/threonine protein kinase